MKGTPAEEERVAPKIVLFNNKQHATVDTFSPLQTYINKDCIELENFHQIPVLFNITFELQGLNLIFKHTVLCMKDLLSFIVR